MHLRSLAMWVGPTLELVGVSAVAVADLAVAQNALHDRACVLGAEAFAGACGGCKPARGPSHTV